jgi:hypothetical protein
MNLNLNHTYPLVEPPDVQSKFVQPESPEQLDERSTADRSPGVNKDVRCYTFVAYAYVICHISVVSVDFRKYSINFDCSTEQLTEFKVNN